MTRKIKHRKNYFRAIDNSRAKEEEERLIQEALAARSRGLTVYRTDHHHLYTEYRARKLQREREAKAAAKYRLESMEEEYNKKLAEAATKCKDADVRVK